MGTKNFSNYSDMITFSRASTGTYLDSDGLLKSAATNTPRVEYDYQGNRLGLLVEEARTNLLTYSEDFTQWLNETSVDTVSSTVSPDGSAFMTLLSEDTATTRHILYQHLAGQLDVNRTFSVFVKKPATNGRRYVVLSIPNTADTLAYSAIFDLDTGLVTATKQNGTATISLVAMQDFGGGIYRCILSGNSNSATSNSFFPIIGLSDRADFSGTLYQNNIPSYTGDGTSGVYIWGAQLEAGTFPTSYIPTSGATATRSADVASIGVGAFGYNKVAGSFVAQFKSVALGYHAINFNTDTNNRVVLYASAETIYAYERNSGVVSSNVAMGSTNTDLKKAAIAIKNNSSAALDGTTYSMSALSWPPVTQIHIGSSETGGIQLNGHISSIAYYPRRLTDAQIKALTSPPETPTLSLTFDDSSTSYLETSIHG